MPSIVLGIPLLSGPQLVISGNPWSGQIRPQGGVQFRLHPNASGNAYLGLSGGMTFTSGGMSLSGGGTLDGVLVAPGNAYFLPKIGFTISGSFPVYAWHDAAASGQARLFWEIY